MKPSWKTCLVCVLGVEAVGGLSALLSRQGMKLYQTTILQPPLSPPPIVFPIVWTILYALMGIGLARVLAARPSGARRRAIRVFALQLFFNFLWSILFFRFQMFGLALWWLFGLVALVAWNIKAFAPVDRLAARLQIPYLLWVTFAAYLNLGVWWLNR